MNTYDSLFEGVLADPDDDEVRLVISDWFEEHGDPERAEFIRLQIQIAHADKYHPQLPAWQTRERQLLLEHRHRWLPPALPGIHWGAFRRGWVHAAKPRSFEVFHSHREYIFRFTPLTSLDLNQKATSYDLQTMAKQPWLERLHELQLARCRFQGYDLVKLAWSPYVGNVRVLNLERNLLRTEGLRALLRGGNLTSLQELNLRQTSLTADVVSEFCHWSGGMLLTRLDLTDNKLPDSIAYAFSAARYFPLLQSLHLGGNGFSSRVWLELMGCKIFANMCEYHYRRATMVNEPHSLEFPVHSDQPKLHCLNLQSCRFHESGLEALAKSTALKELRELNLCDNFLSTKAIQTLTRSQYLGQLQHLDLSYNKLDDIGIVHLKDLLCWSTLRTLQLNHNQIGSAAAKALMPLASWPELQHLDLRQNSIPSPDRTRLKKAFGDRVLV